MPRKLSAYLWDLKITIDQIADFTGQMTFEDFEKNDLIIAGVERKISVLGEALRQMLEHYPSEDAFVGLFTPLIGFQDYLIHQYSRVNRPILWDVVLLMPELREIVSARRAELGLSTNTSE